MRYRSISVTLITAVIGVPGLFSSTPLRADNPPQFSPWSEPVNLGVPVNHVSGDFFPFQLRDGATIYYTISTCPATSSNANCFSDPDASGGFDIYVVKWNSVTQQWGEPQNLGPTINTSANEMAPSLSPDGHLMFFASDRGGGFGGNDLYVSRRHNKRDDFGWLAAENLGPNINTAPLVQPDGTILGGNESSPEVFEDDATGVITLYFDSNRLGGLGPFTDDSPSAGGAHNGNDIYASTLLSDGTFGLPMLVPNLNTTFTDRGPTIRRDGLEMIFASNRPGSLGGTSDLWVSTRTSTLLPWSIPVDLGAVVNADRITVGGVTYTGADAGPALSFDGTTLIFHSSRPGVLGAFDLYMSTRKKLKLD